jgi:hypothetical protein
METLALTKPWPDRSRIEKVRSDPGDSHAVGTRGTVVRYFGGGRLPESGKAVHGYIIRWDGDPREFLCFNDGRFELMEDVH